MLRRVLAIAAVSILVVGVLVLAWRPGRSRGTPQRPGGPTTRPEKAVLPAETRAKAARSLGKGVKFLLAAQEPDGSWSGKFGPAITAMAVKALVRAGQPIDSAPVRKGLGHVLSKQNRSEGKLKGAFADQALANYNTAICLSALVMANSRAPGRPYDAAIKSGLAFLRRDQWDESEGIDKKDTKYGGFGYGGGERPDMSNTTTTMDALKALQDAGYLEQNDPMYQKVQVFLQRSQNRSESNDAGSFAVGDDGGFIYTPALSPTRGGPESKSGKVTAPDGKSRLRSYGSMTYAGFKSYVYSGLPKDDPRVTAAFNWIRKNYTVQENPGIGAQGLFYYYHTFARALAAGEVTLLKDAANVPHDWRAELIDKLVGLQKADGSWVNEKASRWEEGNPVLATCFAMLAIEEAIAAK